MNVTEAVFHKELEFIKKLTTYNGYFSIDVDRKLKKVQYKYYEIIAATLI